MGENMGKVIQVTESAMPSIDEYFAEVKELWDTHWLTNMGIKHQEFEKELGKYLCVPWTSLFVNGHQALECILETLCLSGEIITTPFTFASTTHAIVRKGLKPVFCDIDPLYYTIDPTKIESLITEQTSAILPVHVYGNICATEEIDKIAKKYSLKVIYDAAHAFGVKKDGKGIGLFGDANMFSFHATKVFNSIEGGAITSPWDDLYERLSQWKNFGIIDQESVEFIGGNAKMNEFCAAMGLCNLRHIDEIVTLRQAVFEKYQANLCNLPGVILPSVQSNIKSNYSYYPILIDQENCGICRDEVYRTLFEHNIRTRKYFYPLTSDYTCYKGLFNSEATPIAQKVSRQVLTLPIHSRLSSEDVDRICEIILSLLSV